VVGNGRPGVASVRECHIASGGVEDTIQQSNEGSFREIGAESLKRCVISLGDCPGLFCLVEGAETHERRFGSSL
jgi:hypothetical protein